MTLNMFEMAALILSITAAACWFNANLFKLPVAVGLLLVGLLVTVLVKLTDWIAPGFGAAIGFSLLNNQIDFPSLVLNFMLAYLLFAGAMNVNLHALARRGWAAGILAVLGTAITAGLVAVAFLGVCRLLGIDMPLSWALVFGALISPTDPIAVLAMTKRTDLEPHLQAQLEGEALFNDGFAVVLFKALLAYAVGSAAGGTGGHTDLLQISHHAFVEAFGGMGVGLAVAVAAVAILYVVDDWATETLITLATATVVYAINLHFELSGPLGVVVAGLVMGSDWAEKSFSERSHHYIHPFWHVTDEAMNAVLFFLVGLKAFELNLNFAAIVLMIAGPAMVLASRWIAVALPSAGLPLFRRKFSLKLCNVLTWAGVRGGLSIAMVLSLPDIPARQPIFAAALGVVIFSIVVQSMTMEKLALSTGYGTKRENPDPEP